MGRIKNVNHHHVARKNGEEAQPAQYVWSLRTMRFSFCVRPITKDVVLTCAQLAAVLPTALSNTGNQTQDNPSFCVHCVEVKLKVGPLGKMLGCISTPREGLVCRKPVPFVGNFRKLKKHMKEKHPHACPRAVDPALETKWKRLERDRDRRDVISTIMSSTPGAVVLGDYVIEPRNRGVYNEED